MLFLKATRILDILKHLSFRIFVVNRHVLWALIPFILIQYLPHISVDLARVYFKLVIYTSCSLLLLLLLLLLLPLLLLILFLVVIIITIIIIIVTIIVIITIIITIIVIKKKKQVKGFQRRVLLVFPYLKKVYESDVLRLCAPIGFNVA